MLVSFACVLLIWEGIKSIYMVYLYIDIRCDFCTRRPHQIPSFPFLNVFDANKFFARTNKRPRKYIFSLDVVIFGKIQFITIHIYIYSKYKTIIFLSWNISLSVAVEISRAFCRCRVLCVVFWLCTDHQSPDISVQNIELTKALFWHECVVHRRHEYIWSQRNICQNGWYSLTTHTHTQKRKRSYI